jgi:hypothetical protein
MIAEEGEGFVHMRGSFDFIAPQWEAFAGHADIADNLAMSPGINPSFYANHCVGGCSGPWAGRVSDFLCVSRLHRLFSADHEALFEL